ncbi:MAG: hypothetical protein IJ482_07680 [Alphaproteobacteria bacterium]|nr:hypothetical protein [Alphaproteobacteria bacterium]
MILERKPCGFKTIGFNGAPYRRDDDKDFHIGSVEKNVLTDSLPERDDQRVFDADMYNFGEEDDLPDSDRIMQCQTKGISQKKCLDI